MNDHLLRREWIRLHGLAMNRLQTEDLLLAQRTYNFVTVNAFLAAGLGLAASAERLVAVPFVIAIFGAGFGVLQLAIGRANERSITFWRAYVRMLESRLAVRLDSAMFDFFRFGSTDSGVGFVVNAAKGTKARNLSLDALPSWLSSTNIWVGVCLPILVILFWASILTILVSGMDAQWFLVDIRWWVFGTGLVMLAGMMYVVLAMSPAQAISDS